MGAPVRGKTIWICVASQTILIKSYWLGIERLACGRGAPDPSGSRSLMSSTAGFTGANLFNKGLARMLQGLILIQPRQTVCGCSTGHKRLRFAQKKRKTHSVKTSWLHVLFFFMNITIGLQLKKEIVFRHMVSKCAEMINELERISLLLGLSSHGKLHTETVHV